MGIRDRLSRAEAPLEGLPRTRRRHHRIFASRPWYVDRTVHFRRAELDKKDYRNSVEQIEGDSFEKNLQLVNKLKEVAEKKGCSLSLDWPSAGCPHRATTSFSIPGTKKTKRISTITGEIRTPEAGEIRHLVDDLGSRCSLRLSRLKAPVPWTWEGRACY
ncbi:hypothetical protein V8C37DRAFT_364594 [Trichoderma ceciliae]